MTAVIHHGDPGSYKSFAVIQRVVIPELKKGRVVVTNIRGLDSLDRVKEALKIDKLPDTAQLININADQREGFEHAARFFHWAPLGALIVLDESQRVYPTRIKNLSVYDYTEDQSNVPDAEQRPPTVEVAFDQHRHYNWDIYLTTPAIDKVNKEIRLVCQYAYYHRNLVGLIPKWLAFVKRVDWRENKHRPTNNGEALSNHIDRIDYVADKRVYRTYQSTKTGIAKGSLEAKSIFSYGRIRFFLAVIGLSIASFLYNLSNLYSDDQTDDNVVVQNVVESGDKNLGTDNHNGVGFTGAQSSDQVPDNLATQTMPFSTYQIFLTAQIGYKYLFDIIDTAGNRFSYTSVDLAEIGFRFISHSKCYMVLSFGNMTRDITCPPYKSENFQYAGLGLPTPSASYSRVLVSE